MPVDFSYLTAAQRRFNGLWLPKANSSASQSLRSSWPDSRRWNVRRSMRQPLPKQYPALACVRRVFRRTWNGRSCRQSTEHLRFGRQKAEAHGDPVINSLLPPSIINARWQLSRCESSEQMVHVEARSGRYFLHPGQQLHASVANAHERTNVSSGPMSWPSAACSDVI